MLNFITARDANSRLAYAHQGPRSGISSSYALRLAQPGGNFVYPRDYITTLTRSGLTQFTNSTIRGFNESAAGRAAIASAKTEFDKGYAEAVKASARTGYLTVDIAADLVGTSVHTIMALCHRKLLGLAVDDDRNMFVGAPEFRGLFKWDG